MPSNPPPDCTDEATRRIARDAGLDALLTLDPALIARAQTLARGYAERLRRPESPLSEPAHVYRPQAKA